MNAHARTALALETTSDAYRTLVGLAEQAASAELKQVAWLEPGVLKFIPRNTRFDMPQLFHKLKARRKTITGFPVREYWVDIGRIDDLEKAKHDFSLEFESARA